MDPLRVLVVEDHPLFRKGVVALLDAVPDLAVAGVASSGEEAVTRAAELRPDVVLMDLQLPGHQRHRGDAGDRRAPIPTSACWC